ncbi:MAG: 4'-phosphopantetheinyl transferase superfamily protein [Desulfosarcina sp.]
MDLADTLYPVIIPVPDARRFLKGRDKVAALSRLARVALAESCRKSDLRLDGLPKNENGVPLPVDGVHWSLTHKSDVVGGVASRLPVGIDLETIRPVSDALCAKVADRREWLLVGEKDRSMAFFRIWTAKEAVLKAVGKGMAGLSRCRVTAVDDRSRMTLTYDGACWAVAHFWFDDHVAALTCHHFEVAWSLVA